MGVKELWSVVAPVGHHMPLNHLSGQTLAVDLSIWVCETQGVKRMQGVVTKPHLRYMTGSITYGIRLFLMSHYFSACMYLFYVVLFTKYDIFSGGYFCQNIKRANTDYQSVQL